MGDQVPHYKANLREYSTEDLIAGLVKGTFDTYQKLEAERILREREAQPDRRLAQWAIAIAVGSLCVSILTWFIK